MLWSVLVLVSLVLDVYRRPGAPSYHSSLDMWQYIGGTAPTLMGCVSLSAVLKRLAGSRAGVWTIKAMARRACVHYGMASEDGCRQIISAHSDNLVWILRHSTLSSKEICQRLDFCASPIEHDYFPSNVPYPEINRTDYPAKSSHIIQLSDIHLDPLYQRGAEAACPEVVCCRNDSRSAKPNSPSSSTRMHRTR